jgi:peptidoglycan-associated lipoprotein
MTKVVKAFLVGLIVIACVLAPACRSKKAPRPKVAPVEVQPPPITIPPPPPSPVTTTVEQTDFVKTDTTATEPTVRTTALPSNVEDLNRVVQERGYLQDPYYGYDESALTPQAQGALTVSANWLKQNPQYNLLIEGHCDERGTEQYNLALGDRRANIVKEYLMTLGVDGSRIRTVSYGEERPFDPGHDEAAWAKNRRAHLVLVGR